MREVAALAAAVPAGPAETADALENGAAALETATAWLIEADDAVAAAGSVPYLGLLGTVCAGWLMTRQALAAARSLAAGDGDPAFLSAKLATARFFAEHFVMPAPGCLAALRGGAAVLAFDPDRF